MKPTRWRWTDSESVKTEFIQELQKLKEKEKQKRKELKERKDKFKDIIKSKLTKEELKYITFK